MLWLRFIYRSCLRLLIVDRPRFSSWCEPCGGECRIDGRWCENSKGQMWLRSKEQKERLKAWDRGELGFCVED